MLQAKKKSLKPLTSRRSKQSVRTHTHMRLMVTSWQSVRAYIATLNCSHRPTDSHAKKHTLVLGCSNKVKAVDGGGVSGCPDDVIGEIKVGRR